MGWILQMTMAISWRWSKCRYEGAANAKHRRTTSEWSSSNQRRRIRSSVDVYWVLPHPQWSETCCTITYSIRKGTPSIAPTYSFFSRANRALCLSSAVFHFTKSLESVRRLLTRIRVDIKRSGTDQTVERNTPWRSKYGCRAKLFQWRSRMLFSLSAK